MTFTSLETEVLRVTLTMKEKRGWRSWPALEPMMVINDLEESGSGLDVPCGVCDLIGLASSLTKSAFSVSCS